MYQVCSKNIIIHHSGFHRGGGGGGGGRALNKRQEGAKV